MRFGIVADDNTGATDAAGMLTEKGVRTVLFIALPGPKHLEETAREYDAAVIGASTRSIAPKEAYDRTAEAVGLLRQLGVEKLQIKYCSTFDSTPEGNIGPTLAWCHSANNLGAVGLITQPVIFTLAASESLHDDLGVFVYKNCHGFTYRSK